MEGVVLHESHTMLNQACIHCTGCKCHNLELLKAVCTEKTHQRGVK